MFLRLSLIQSSRFSAAPTCSIYHLHRMGVRCGMLLRLPQRKLIWVTNWRTSLFQRSAIKLVRPFRMILGILYDVFSTLWKIHAVQGRIPNWQGSALGTFPLLWSSRGKEASCRLHWLSDTWKVTIRTVHNCTCQGCTWTCLIPRLPPPWINEGTVFAGWISNQNTDSDIEPHWIKKISEIIGRNLGYKVSFPGCPGRWHGCQWFEHVWTALWSVYCGPSHGQSTSLRCPERWRPLIHQDAWCSDHTSVPNALKTSRFNKPKQLMLGSDRDLLGGDYFACLPCNGFLAFGPYNVHAGSMREAYGSWEGTPLAASSFQVCGNQHFDNRPFMIRKVQRMISACCHDTKLLSMWLISETWRNMSLHPRSSSKDVPIKKYILKSKRPNAKHNII